MKLITQPTNLHYLTGFQGSSGFLIMGKHQNVFFTDFRYKEMAEQLAKHGGRIPFEFVELKASLKDDLKRLFPREKRVEFEANHLTVNRLKHWKTLLPKKSWEALEKGIESQRLLKEKEEIRLLKKSQEINEKTLYRIQKLFKNGVEEQELAWQIKAIGHELGADDISFEPIVAFGNHSAIPHHHPTARALKANETVLIDMGMKLNGYCSDMTRTFFFGKASSEQRAIYAKVLAAQEAGIKAIRHGVKASQVDLASRKSMGEDQEFFGHSLGHGIGLEVHEAPNLSSRSKDTLKKGMVVTVEPGIYLEGRFGVRIEDMGLVTEMGYENFTKAPK